WLRESVAAGAFYLDESWLPNWRPRDALPRRRPRPGIHERWNRDGLPDLRRLVKGLDDADVLQAFLAGRFGLAPFRDAIGEIQQFRRELIASPCAPARPLAVDREGVLQPL